MTGGRRQCEFCGSSGAYPGEACYSCGKGGTTRDPKADEMLRVRGGGEPRRYSAFKGANRRNGT